MAAPHVVGAAALIWRACNSCTNTQVSQCLEDTAMDIGTTGRDNQFGHGLVQTETAYLCLINDIGCCSAAQVDDTSNPSSAPITKAPIRSPTTPPTISPSMTPIGAPTTSPIISPIISFGQFFSQVAPTGKPTNAPSVAPTTDAPTDKPTNTPTIAPTTASTSQPSSLVESIMDRKQCTPIGGLCSDDTECCQYSHCDELFFRKRCSSFLFSFPSPP
jgi:serine protease